MMPENDLYGHKIAMSWYCGRPKPLPIFGTIPHGWAVDLEPSNRKIEFAPLLLWNERHLSQAAALDVKNVQCIGAPFSYLVRTLWPDHVYPRGSGTLVFPQHSHETGRNPSSIKKMVAAVEEAFEPPYTVSVAYDDWNRPSTQTWRDAGWRVISFGPRGGRSQFLVRVALEMAAHSAVVTNQANTALMYGAVLGRDVRVLGPTVEWPEPDPNPANINAAPSLWPVLHESGLTGERALELGKFELGWNSNVPPQRLAEILGWASVPRLAAAQVIARIIDMRLGRRWRQGYMDPAERGVHFVDVGRPSVPSDE